MRLDLSKTNIDYLKKEDGTIVNYCMYRDYKHPFGLRVYNTGRKVWYYYGGPKPLKLGTYPELQFLDLLKQLSTLSRELPLILTVEDTLNAFCEHFYKPCYDTLVRLLRKNLQQINFMQVPIKEFNNAHLVHYYTSLKKDSGIFSLEAQLTLMKQIHKKLKKNNFINTEHTLSFVPGVPPRKKQKILSQLDLQLIFEHCSSKRPPFNLLPKILYYTGLRLGDALSLKIEDFDLINDTLSIREEKTHRDRVIPVHPSLREFISYMQKEQKTGHIFKVGTKYISKLQARKFLSYQSTKLGIYFRAHTFRRTLATHLLDTNTNSFTIMSILGHKKLSKTLLYARPQFEHQKKAILSLKESSLF